MIVLRIAASDRVDLEEAADLRRFHVRVEGSSDPERIATAFASTGLGRFETLERTFVRVDRVRALAAGRTCPGWDTRFEAMLEYAAGKGWYDTGAGLVQAHCEVAGS